MTRPPTTDPISELRDLANRLTSLADVVSGGHQHRPLKSEQEYLRELAQLEQRLRQIRERHLPGDLFAEPAWAMLLDLFLEHGNGNPQRTTSLCIASGVPTTTALRWISILERLGLVQRNAESGDARARLVSLTEKGHETMTAILRDFARSHGTVAALLPSSQTPYENGLIITGRPQP